MRIVREGAVEYLSDKEIDWCKAHPEMPEAQEALAAHALVRDDPRDRTLHDRAVAAISALRAINPRAPHKIEDVFAWVMWDPTRNPTIEGIPSLLKPEPIGNGRSLNSFSFLMGFDREHLRALRSEAEEVRSRYGMTRRGMRLQRMTFDRVVEPHKIKHLRSRNLASKTVEEVFAYIASPPDSQDETILALKLPGDLGGELIGERYKLSPAEQVVLPLAHADAERIVAMDAAVKPLRATGKLIELRRYVRAETLDEDEFFAA